MSADTDTGVLLIHGLGGTQYDLGPCTRSSGAPAGDPCPDARPRRRAGRPDRRARLDAVTAKYREVAGRHDTLHVMGMCLGGLLAVELCKRENHRKGRLVSLAAPVFIDGWSTPWYRGLRHLVYRIPAGRRHAGRRGRTLWPEERAGPLHRQGQVRAWRELPLPLGAPVLRPGGRPAARLGHARPGRHRLSDADAATRRTATCGEHRGQPPGPAGQQLSHDLRGQ